MDADDELKFNSVIQETEVKVIYVGQWQMLQHSANATPFRYCICIFYFLFSFNLTKNTT